MKKTKMIGYAILGYLATGSVISGVYTPLAAYHVGKEQTVSEKYDGFFLQKPYFWLHMYARTVLTSPALCARTFVFSIMGKAKRDEVANDAEKTDEADS